MEKSLTNLELEDLLKVTFVFSISSAMVDTESTDEHQTKVGQIIIETISEELMNSAFENAFSGGNQFDIEGVMDKITEEFENDTDATLAWADQKFDTFDRNTKVNVMSSVYKVLLVDGKITDHERDFLNEVLSHYQISLDEVIKVAEEKSGLYSDMLSLSDSEEEDKED
jgi:hypothetical protein